MTNKLGQLQLGVTPLTGASYKNAQHYIDEGWHREPKRLFVRLGDVIGASDIRDGQSVLDIGCATGELIGYLKRCFSGLHFTGIELSSAVAAEARRLVPFADIKEGSALALKEATSDRFDIVIGSGVMGIFDFDELKTYVDGLASVVKDGGRVLMAEPFNQYGMDLIAAHRKRHDGKPGEWERGNSIFTCETLKELFAGRAKAFTFHTFELDIDLPRREDPQRTWTIVTAGGKRQVINGLNLLMNIGILEAHF